MKAYSGFRKRFHMFKKVNIKQISNSRKELLDLGDISRWEIPLKAVNVMLIFLRIRQINRQCFVDLI